MPNICHECVREKHLRTLIEREGVVAQCTNCEEKTVCLDVESPHFFQLVKALVRFHYSEWDYNPHWGGDEYESLFCGDGNIFFEPRRSVSKDAYDEIVANIVAGPVYEDYDRGVSVFAGYGPGGVQNMLLEAIKSDLDHELLGISEDLKTKNHFLLEKDVTNILLKYKDAASITIHQGFELFRARVGYERKRRALSMGFEAEYHYVPFWGPQIGSPPPYLAAAGRVNRSGVSFLYCATDEYTAVSEVRPHPADHVSIGKFRLRNDVLLFDLSDSKLLSFYLTDKDIDNFKPLNTLGVLLNRTIPPSERGQYSITQLIADCIRQLGFQGILFNSTVGTGRNVVLFNESDAEQLEEGRRVIEVKKVSYSYSEETLVDDEKPENYEI